MFPHGTRPAHTPRRTSATVSRPNESQVSDIPMLARRRPESITGCSWSRSRTATDPDPDVPDAGAPAATALAVLGRRPLAKDAAKNTIAMVRVSIVA